MVEVETEEDRINPCRKRRLRKKLHVAEFQQLGIELLIDNLTASDEDDENIDHFLDKLEVIAKNYGWESGYVMFSDGVSSTLHITIPNSVVENDENTIDNLVSQLEDETEYDISIQSVDDAYYPDERCIV